MQSKHKFIVISLIGLCGPSVFAQDFIPNMNAVDYNLPKYATENSPTAIAVNKIAVRQFLQPTALGVVPTSASSKYAISLTRRRANLAQFVEKSRKSDPAGAKQMAALFAKSDPIEALKIPLGTYGLRVDNVADAYTTYWMQAWQAAHGDTSDFTRGQTLAVKAQAARALGSTSEFATATDVTKQEFAEAMLVQASLIAASIEVYKNDPAMMRKLGDAVRKGAQASGLDLDAMTLTEQGFVPSGKTGSLNPAPNQQQASATPAPTAPATPPYALMAAAGGAGIGGVFLLGKVFGRRG